MFSLLVTLIQLRNFFLNGTTGNFKRMNSLLRDHLDKLARAAASDPAINLIYLAFVPIAKIYFDAYQAVQNNAAFYKGCTKDFSQTMAELSSTHIRRWDVAIQNVFDLPTGDYVSLLPNGRAPFQNGSYEARLIAVSSLLANLRSVNHPDLQALIAKIDTWLSNVNALRSKQQGLEGDDSRLRKQAEDARILVAEAMHKVFFQLCVHFHPNLAIVETFYELKYIRATRSKSSESTTAVSADTKIAPLTRKTLLTDTFSTANVFDINNKGTAKLQVWLSSDEHSTVPADVTMLEPQTASSFLAEELSDGSASWKFLIAYNPSDTDEGRVSVAKQVE